MFCHFRQAFFTYTSSFLLKALLFTNFFCAPSQVLNIGQIKVKDDAITSCTLRSGSLQSNTQTKASFHPTEKPL